VFGDSHEQWVGRIGIGVEMRSLGFSGAMAAGVVAVRGAKMKIEVQRVCLLFSQCSFQSTIQGKPKLG
jgi:hypothetical protein